MQLRQSQKVPSPSNYSGEVKQGHHDGLEIGVSGLWCLVMWLHTSLDVAVKVFFRCD